MDDEKMGELVAYIVRRVIQSDEGSLSDEKKLVEDLMGQGYSAKEIDAALSFIASSISGASAGEGRAKPDERRSFRVLHPSEEGKINKEAYGFLLQMHSQGSLDAIEMDRVINRAMALPVEEVGVEDIKKILLDVLGDNSTTILIPNNKFEGIIK
ncbi:MAG: DUF494 family protein [bacterium]